MTRELWGEFAIEEKPPLDQGKMVPLGAKRLKLTDTQNSDSERNKKSITVDINNDLITQTIEVMKQTEMLQSLIDTYSNQNGSTTYLLSPCQVIPEVDFPPENSTDFTHDKKYIKPVWYMPARESKFIKAMPEVYPLLNAEICRASLRKAVCGLVRVAGFTDATNSALTLFADAVEEFVRNLMLQIKEVHANNPILETQRDVDILCLEKAYYTLMNASLVQVYNYFKHNVIARNRNEIMEFHGMFSEYDKLMKESQRSMMKNEYREGEFINIFEIPQTTDGTINVQQAGGMDTTVEVQPHIILHQDTQINNEQHVYITDMGTNLPIND